MLLGTASRQAKLARPGTPPPTPGRTWQEHTEAMQALATPSDISSLSPNPRPTSGFALCPLELPFAKEGSSLSSPPTPTMRLLPSPYAQQSSCSDCSSHSGGPGAVKAQSPAQLQAVVMKPLASTPTSPADAILTDSSSRHLSGPSIGAASKSLTGTGISQRPSWSFVAPHSPAVPLSPAEPSPASIPTMAAPYQPPTTRSAAGRARLQGASSGPTATAAAQSNQGAKRRVPSSVVAPSAAPSTRRQVAAAASTAEAALQADSSSVSGVVAASRTRQTKKLKPEMPSRVQPVRVAKPRWV